MRLSSSRFAPALLASAMAQIHWILCLMKTTVNNDKHQGGASDQRLSLQRDMVVSTRDTLSMG
eukprot:m.144022 g.144022  ORF g.144022 m.144022 type:complete len:63 (-) comp17179_c1_seq5:54-242(-)